mgnify:FL=1
MVKRKWLTFTKFKNLLKKDYKCGEVSKYWYYKLLKSYKVDYTKYKLKLKKEAA